MGRPKRFSDGLIQRSLRLALEGAGPIAHITHDVGMHPETLRKKVRRAEAQAGERGDLTITQEAGGDLPAA